MVLVVGGRQAAKIRSVKGLPQGGRGGGMGAPHGQNRFRENG